MFVVLPSTGIANLVPLYELDRETSCPKWGILWGILRWIRGRRQRLPSGSQRQLRERVLDKRQLLPACHGLRSVVDVEFAIDVLQMLFDRARGDDQPAGDLLV
jgi:hypothetical protein